MSDKKTGGPAFPSKGNEMARQQALALGMQYNEPSGMTLRDYFAAKAIQAMISTCPSLVEHLQMESDSLLEMRAGCFAEGAYQMADAMLEARK